MIKVKIVFNDGKEQEFYADESYEETNEGRIVYWNNSEKGEIYAYPVQNIFKITETDIEEQVHLIALPYCK